MIVSIRHKGLKQYYETGNGAKLPPEQLRKIARILTALDAITCEDDIKQLGSGIHKLKGDLADFWSLSVTGNYRIIFQFLEGDVLEVDYIDYH